MIQARTTITSSVIPTLSLLQRFPAILSSAWVSAPPPSLGDPVSCGSARKRPSPLGLYYLFSKDNINRGIRSLINTFDTSFSREIRCLKIINYAVYLLNRVCIVSDFLEENKIEPMHVLLYNSSFKVLVIIRQQKYSAR